MKQILLTVLFLLPSLLWAEPKPLSRVELIPLPEHQVSFQVDGVEKTRWHHGHEYPRPFFYPFNGPSGVSLTRMGHPGAQNHDHHTSVWFAHHDIDGESYWSYSSKTQIRQKYWYAYSDGDDEAVMATLEGWYNTEGQEVMEQDVVAALIPMENGEHALEVQITFRPTAKATEPVEIAKTNFGFFAVRVAKTISAYFGGGKLTNSEGAEDEPNIFGKPARWMDYSGVVAVGQGPDRKAVPEGITYFDHPDNPRYPTHWHVRQDGWMGASFCMNEGYSLTADNPLTLRYLLHAHSGAYDPDKAVKVHEDFAARPGFEIGKRKEKHGQFSVWRIEESAEDN